MIESHYAAYVVDAMDDLAAKAIIPLTTASARSSTCCASAR
jgi:hypothetical protein